MVLMSIITYRIKGFPISRFETFTSVGINRGNDIYCMHC